LLNKQVKDSSEKGEEEFREKTRQLCVIWGELGKTHHGSGESAAIARDRERDKVRTMSVTKETLAGEPQKHGTKDIIQVRYGFSDWKEMD